VSLDPRIAVTLCLLVRHAAHDLLDRVLVGRMGGVSLGETGRQQAADLARWLARLSLTSVQSSPRPRATQTAAPIAQRANLPIEISAALDEVDFGLWTGRAFEELAEDPRWVEWNRARGRARAPGGESMVEAQARVVAHLRDVHAANSSGRVVMVTHAEIIRCAVLHCLSLPLDEWSRIDVPPASVTKLDARTRPYTLISPPGGAAASAAIA
jgi:broad specificity phosphatase PhoE